MTDKTPWQVAAEEADAFNRKMAPVQLEHRAGEALIEVARQLILMNGNINTLTETVHRVAQSK